MKAKQRADLKGLTIPTASGHFNFGERILKTWQPEEIENYDFNIIVVTPEGSVHLCASIDFEFIEESETPDKHKAGIELLAIAGYTVKLADRTFSIWENEVKIWGCSTHEWLMNPKFLMDQFILKRRFKQGFDAGRISMQTDFKKLLDLK
jgi:hypothetical protein